MANFEKVGECLYRYTATGTYYARFESGGREIRRSLDTSDRALAKRRLVDLQRSIARTVRDGGKITLAQLCDRYLATTRNQAPATVVRKAAIARRIKADWPSGADVPISKIVTSQISAWLASYTFGVASYNLHLLFVRAAFELAVTDNLLADSPAAGLRMATPKKPIRQTPQLRGVPGHRYQHPRAGFQRRGKRQRRLRGIHRPRRPRASGGRRTPLV